MVLFAPVSISQQRHEFLMAACFDSYACDLSDDFHYATSFIILRILASKSLASFMLFIEKKCHLNLESHLQSLQDSYWLLDCVKGGRKHLILFWSTSFLSPFNNE
jgi:hypothetical protein